MKTSYMLALLVCWLLAPAAQAGPFADELSMCLVQSTTEDDKLKLVKWMFSSMALHPAVADLAPVSDTVRDATNRDMADLMSTLLEDRCLDKARAALQNEGAIALQSSFAFLGQVAANELFSNPEVAAGLAGLTNYLDSEEIDRKLGIGSN